MTKKMLSNSKQQGIALVVVLGMLAVLTIMAMGMAISMRTERLSSKSYLDMVTARLACHAALADSMLCVEEVLSSPKTPNVHLVSPNYRYYFDEKVTDKDYSVMPSIETFPKDPNADYFTNSLIEGTATNFIPYYPMNYWWVIHNSRDSMITRNAQWIHTTKTSPDGTVVTNGRYMYMLIDVSGTVDMNYAGREWEGIYPLNPPAIFEFGRYDQFQTKRDNTHIRYETIRDLTMNGDYGGRGWALDTFSFSPPLRRIEVATEGDANIIKYGEEAVYLSSNRAQWAKGDIEEAFARGINDFDQYSSSLGGTPDNPVDPETALYQMLVDYVDDDFTPAGNNLDRPSIEAVPMVNEIRLLPTNATVEVWQPFVGTERYSKDFKIEVEIDGTPYESASTTMPNSSLTPESVDIDLGTTLSNAVDVIVRIKDDGGDDLDKVELKNIQIDTYSLCNDPRFNHLESQWLKNQTSGSLGSINANAREGYRDKGNADSDGDYLMYCANQPVRFTGELGYLPIGPWRTIKLYEDHRDNQKDMDPVIDYFTVQQDGETRYGPVNPNAPHPNSRKVIIHPFGRRYRLYPDQPDAEGKSILNFSGVTRWLGKQGFQSQKTVVVNPSDIGDHFYSRQIENQISQCKTRADADPITYSELRIEDPMRRASHLSNHRQNKFILCLWGQALSDERLDNGDFIVRAEAQAVAYVWRDAYPASDTPGDRDYQFHRKFVRYMRWME